MSDSSIRAKEAIDIVEVENDNQAPHGVRTKEGHISVSLELFEQLYVDSQTRGKVEPGKPFANPMPIGTFLY